MGENGKENLQVVSRNVLITPCKKRKKNIQRSQLTFLFESY